MALVNFRYKTTTFQKCQEKILFSRRSVSNIRKAQFNKSVHESAFDQFQIKKVWETNTLKVSCEQFKELVRTELTLHGKVCWISEADSKIHLKIKLSTE